MKSTELRVPHFLRVTQALALVSGIGLPGALLGACGGAFATTGDGGGGDGQSAVCDDACAGGVRADDGAVPLPAPPPGYDGAPVGVVVSDASYDGSPVGVVPIRDASYPYDGRPVGVLPYDGGPVGIIIPYDGGPVGVVPITDSGLLRDVILIGGPLDPPDLPA
jgi:hypothetical protein